MLVIIFYFKDSDLEVDSLDFRATQKPAFLALPPPLPPPIVLSMHSAVSFESSHGAAYYLIGYIVPL